MTCAMPRTTCDGQRQCTRPSCENRPAAPNRRLRPAPRMATIGSAGHVQARRRTDDLTRLGRHLDVRTIARPRRRPAARCVSRVIGLNSAARRRERRDVRAGRRLGSGAARARGRTSRLASRREPAALPAALQTIRAARAALAADECRVMFVLFDVDEAVGRADAIEQMPRKRREQPLERLGARPDRRMPSAVDARTAARSSLCSPNTTLTPSADGGLLSVVAGPATGTPNTLPWSSVARGHDGSVCTTSVATSANTPVTGVNTRGLIASSIGDAPGRVARRCRARTSRSVARPPCSVSRSPARVIPA